MCGRAAQTVHVATAAAADLGVNGAAAAANHDMNMASSANSGRPPPKALHDHDGTEHTSMSLQKGPNQDNYNMSPGMDATVIWMEDGVLKVGKKVWGLITKSGNKTKPFPSDRQSRMGMHFSGLMFNARTDTFFSKPTFSRLAQQGRSCVVALDGYFEWKASPLAGGKGKKQPYFVHRSSTGLETSPKQTRVPYLLLAGLWNQVPTGLSEEPYLDTFCILTTEPCQQIEWLHDRMPVCMWSDDLARKWLESPTPKVLSEIDKSSKTFNDGFAWHMVTPEMSSMKFRGKEAILEKKAPPSVASFFKVSPQKKQSTAPKSKSFTTKLEKRESKSPEGIAPKKRKITTTPAPARKKGAITSFFHKKD